MVPRYPRRSAGGRHRVGTPDTPPEPPMEACDMSFTSLRRILAGLAGAAVLAVLPQAASRAEPLQVGYIPIIPMTQLFVLEGEGWSRQAGLDLRTTSFASGPAMIQ